MTLVDVMFVLIEGSYCKCLVNGETNISEHVFNESRSVIYVAAL